MVRRAFTLVELLVVVAIAALLAALLLPSLSSAQARGKRAHCANNLKQLSLCVQMYSADNAGRLPENLPFSHDTLKNNWVLGNMMEPRETTNAALLQAGKLFPYAPNTALYHCPGDGATATGMLRARSYSMNGWMGSRYMQSASNDLRFRTFIRDSELASAGAALLWVFMDEHPVSLDDGWFLVTMDDSRPFASVPGMRHDFAYTASFADGHVEGSKMRDPTSARLGVGGNRASPNNSDWLRLKQLTTIQ
ncbi:MAG TPA: prepilin-type N-terminal cleavage/methylation domain-containing protein [Clostridia bacterium]|nr:prepilin-type N-terminal cleavage/methylation domain-containing protein [Clostridia bacterium]